MYSTYFNVDMYSTCTRTLYHGILATKLVKLLFE